MSHPQFQLVNYPKLRFLKSFSLFFWQSLHEIFHNLLKHRQSKTVPRGKAMQVIPSERLSALSKAGLFLKKKNMWRLEYNSKHSNLQAFFSFPSHSVFISSTWTTISGQQIWGSSRMGHTGRCKGSQSDQSSPTCSGDNPQLQEHGTWVSVAANKITCILNIVRIQDASNKQKAERDLKG